MRRTTFCGASGPGRSQPHIEVPAITASATATTGQSQRTPPGSTTTCCGASPTSATSIATLASPMSRRRFFALRSRQRRSRPRIAGGVSPGNLSKSIGQRSTSASVCEIGSPAKRRWPVSISHSTTPNDQISARLSTGLPLAFG